LISTGYQELKQERVYESGPASMAGCRRPPRKTSLSSRIAGLQTLGPEEDEQMVLSVTVGDWKNDKYLIKLPQADKLQAAAKEDVKIEKVSSWDLERLGTALSTGDNPLPMSIALKISQVAVEDRQSRDFSKSKSDLRCRVGHLKLVIVSF